MSNTTKVLDQKGIKIVAGSIARIVDPDKHWTDHEGVVITPHSDDIGDGCTVPVFFGLEVDKSHFNFNRVEVEKWDEGNCDLLKTMDTTLIVREVSLKTCPRVVFFEPECILVQDRWGVSTLAERYFKRLHHHTYDLPSNISPRPGEYKCFCKECPNTASKLAVFNVWGSVYPLYVCDSCFTEVNGMCGDDLPETKHPWLLANGQPVPSPKKQ